MMTATATYQGDDIRVVFACKMERVDYGVPGSPTWFEPVLDSAEIDDLEMLGVSVDPRTLPRDLMLAVYGLADGLDWEMEVE